MAHLNYKAVLFDFDGTLADTSDGIVLTMQKTFEALGKPVPAAEAVRKTIGLPLRDCVRRLGATDEAEAATGEAIYKRLFSVYEVNAVRLFDGVAETLAHLQDYGVRMAICTNRNRFSLDCILERHGLTGFFEAIITADTHHARPKPAPDMALALLEQMGVEAGDALVVGDTTYDIAMGSGARCHTVAVTYGNHPAEVIGTACPTYMIDHFGVLETIVLNGRR